jgi:hypothetical protein
VEERAPFFFNKIIIIIIRIIIQASRSSCRKPHHPPPSSRSLCFFPLRTTLAIAFQERCRLAIFFSIITHGRVLPRVAACLVSGLGCLQAVVCVSSSSSQRRRLSAKQAGRQPQFGHTPYPKGKPALVAPLLVFKLPTLDTARNLVSTLIL